jgi:hypothetical protein
MNFFYCSFSTLARSIACEQFRCRLNYTIIISLNSHDSGYFKDWGCFSAIAASCFIPIKQEAAKQTEVADKINICI